MNIPEDFKKNWLFTLFLNIFAPKIKFGRSFTVQENKEIAPLPNQLAIEFVNDGNVLAFINGRPLYPGSSPLVYGMNGLMIDQTNYQIIFSEVSLPASPVRMIYVTQGVISSENPRRYLNE